MVFHTYLNKICCDAKSAFEERRRIFKSTTPISVMTSGSAVSNGDQRKIAFDEEEDYLAHARYINHVGKVGFVIAIVIFNLVFWAVALSEFFTAAEHYLDLYDAY